MKAQEHRGSCPKRTGFWVCVILMTVLGSGRADDWPTLRHDNHRSGKTAERIDAAALGCRWVWRSPQPPQPAWAGPAKWDAFKNMPGLRSMRDYDQVFHVIAAGDRVWFGSSVDDSVRCLDAADGQERWSYTTDGPVRIAPTLTGGRLYFGSDDGHAYCIDATDGSLLWKHAPAAERQRIVSNGRMISLWPCRTGVLVDGTTAHFAMGMLPWEESYLCAVDARTGKPDGSGHYIATHSGLTMEGAMLASRESLFSPQGRVPPLVFDRNDGRKVGSLDGKAGGGCFVVITEDDRILHGPGNKTGWVTESNAVTREKIATISGATAMVVDNGTAYLLSDDRLAALDRQTKKPRWEKACEYPYALILAADTLLVGGRDVVAAMAADDGKLLWQHEVAGRAYGLAVAGGRLFVSTDEGAIYAFEPRADRNTVRDSSQSMLARSPATGSGSGLPSLPVAGDRANSESPTVLDPISLKIGPYLQFTGPDSAIVRWETDEPSPTVLEYAAHGRPKRIEDPAAKTRHEVTLAPLRRGMVYRYTISATVDDETHATRAFECDTFFNYSEASTSDHTEPAEAKTAEHILSSCGVRQGICLVLGSGDGRLAYELARQSRLRVIGLESDAARVASARRMLKSAGIYGARVAVHQVDSLETIPFVDGFANLVVSMQGDTAAEASRLAQPDNGVTATLTGNQWVCTTRPALDGAGVWSHLYGLPDNSAYGGESLQGARGVDEMAVRWLGRPGPRAQADRNGRKPSPLAIGGRLFMQGLNRIIAIDAYNGTILWSLEIPDFERFNMPRDCSNWCADEDHLFAVVKDRCWQIDTGTGQVVATHHRQPGPIADSDYEWGYVARSGELLLGSTVKSGSSYTDFFGGTGWYDKKNADFTNKVCSERLFAIDKSSGDSRWSYLGGPIINPTITMTDDRVYFVECRNKATMAQQTRRLGGAEFWQDQFLVALDTATGKKVWETPIDTADGTVVFYMAYGDGKLVLVSSDQKYHVYARDAENGSPLWETHFDWPSDNHGHHMSRPAIAHGNVYVRPKVIDLATGRIHETPMPDGGCGTYAIADGAITFRASNITMWNPEQNRKTSWSRLRPGCWLSTIPACGMLLSPEAGGGCSCGKWMETSLGFAPAGSK
ncbi:MAG: PQQ-binding-like beta-propeller repeat protein [Thermoguttaceae bacterium]